MAVALTRVCVQFTVPTMALRVVDRAMQAFGAEGISQDQPLAQMYAGLRTLRYADVSHRRPRISRVFS